ncbi:MAG: DUF5606 domain-containing protein [Dysgonamonadaceae bacterium]|jgi:hypothetical protein|nr:DUF5606 domain-containing protein [Dysgonamonadaceae bacterium]
MLKEILSVSGKPGLFKMVSQGKNMYIVESLLDGKRVPVYARDKVVSLGDIAVYTETEELPLATVLNNIKIKESGAAIDMKSNIQPAELRTYFEQILPEYDKDKVYPSDMKKIMGWYNILLNAGITDFEKVEQEETPPTPKGELDS